MVNFDFYEWKMDYIPPPPKRPEVDPKEDIDPEYFWSWKRMYSGTPVKKGAKPWSRMGEIPQSDEDPDWRGVVRKNVRQYQAPEPYTHGMKTDTKYFWFDTPDYADPFKKLWYSCRFFTMTGIMLTCLIAGVTCKTFTIPDHIYHTRKIFAPYFFGGMAASLTVLVTANLRDNKDDMLNYAIGGAAMGTVIGRKSYLKVVRNLFIYPPIAMMVKYNAEVNGQIYPVFDPKRVTNIIAGGDTTHGITSGDFRFGYRMAAWKEQEDPGRDVRKPLM